MKRCGVLLLMLCLTLGIGFPLFAQRNPDRFAMNESEEKVQANLKEPDNSEEPQIKETRQDEEEPQDKTRIKLSGNQLVVEDLSKDGILDIYNIMGVKVYNRRIKAGTNQYILSLPKGYYIIKIDKLTRKIAVK